MSEQSANRKRLTVPDLKARKQAKQKVVMVSIPDFPSAVWAERAGIDIAAVGDSLGMADYGHPNTLPVTVDMMIEHTRAVRRGAPNCMVLVAMPYGSYATAEIGVLNALRIMKEGGADVVKMQGGREKAPIIKAIADAGVPVMSHVGMCPLHASVRRLQAAGKNGRRSIADHRRRHRNRGGWRVRLRDRGRARAGSQGGDRRPCPSSRSELARGRQAAASCCSATTCSAYSISSSRSSPSATPNSRRSPSARSRPTPRTCAPARFPDADHSYSMNAEEVEKLKALAAKRRARN